MRWWNALVVAACASQAAAHADPNDPQHGVPKLAGSRRFMNKLARKRWETRAATTERIGMVEARNGQGLAERDLETRQSSKRCGGSRGSCSSGQCCSADG